MKKMIAIVLIASSFASTAYAETEEMDYGNVSEVSSNMVTTTTGEVFEVSDPDNWNENDSLSATINDDEDPVVITNDNTGAEAEQ